MPNLVTTAGLREKENADQIVECYSSRRTICKRHLPSFASRRTLPACPSRMHRELAKRRKNLMNTNGSTVVGVFAKSADARKAFSELRAAGFTDEHLGVVGRDDDVRKEVTGSPEGNAVAGATAGVAAGAGIGLLWGLGVAANLIPAIGPVIAGGTFAALAASAAAGAATVGIAGALVGWGIPKEDAAHYESEVKAGRILVTVKADRRYEAAESIIRKCGGTTKIPVAVV
jgi:hypothetical protein